MDTWILRFIDILSYPVLKTVDTWIFKHMDTPILKITGLKAMNTWILGYIEISQP